MRIEKVKPIEAAPIIFEIVKRAFNRSFDKCPANVQEVIDYIKDSDVYLLYDNEFAIGNMVIKQESPTLCELKSISVAEENQGKGYGSYLMKQALDLTQGKHVHLVTHPKNIQALMLYLKNGFVITGWIDNYLGDGQPRLKLEK